MYSFKVHECHFYDGDSGTIVLDLGFGIKLSKKFRLNGIDTPELRGGTAQSKALAKLARNRARLFVLNAGTDLFFVSERYGKTEKYGRALGDLKAVDNRVSLVDILLTGRFGVAYSGQSKAEIQEAHEANIEYHKENL